MADGLLGVVLAGGRSSRMGRDKALLEIDGVSLLARAIALLHEAGAERVVVSGDRPQFSGVPDVAEGRGPVGGIVSVLAAHPGSALVAIPVDQPKLDAHSLRQLIEALEHAPAACFEAHPLPWAARVDEGLRAAIDAAFVERPQGPSMHRLHELCGGVAIPVSSAVVLGNVNTPADWRALQ